MPEELQNNQNTESPYISSTDQIREGLSKGFSSIMNLAPFLKQRMGKTQYQGGYSPYTQMPSMGYNNIKNAFSSLGTITTPFGGGTRYESFHPGIDIANKIGTPISSFFPGIVKEVASGFKKGDKGYGNYIVVEDPYGNKHRYSHLSKSFVRIGQPVRVGQNIGAMGATGSVYSTSGGTGSHLDYRIRNAAGKYLNPYEYLSNFYRQRYG